MVRNWLRKWLGIDEIERRLNTLPVDNVDETTTSLEYGVIKPGNEEQEFSRIKKGYDKFK